MLVLIKDLKTKYNLQVQQLWCKNAGENQAFEWACDQEGLGINFEYTAPGTSQQNGRVEWKFATLFNPVHAMLNSGKFTSYLHSSLLAEAANTATFLENHLTTPKRSLNPFQHFFGKGKSNVFTSMQKFGEMCIATFMNNTHLAKLANHGTPGIWVGYAENHLTGTCRIFNPKTKCNILTQDVTFLDKSYSECRKVEKPVILTMNYERSNGEEEPEIVPVECNNNGVNIVTNSDNDLSNDDLKNNEENLFDEEVDDKVISTTKPTLNAKAVWAMKKLQALYIDNVNKIIKDATHVKISKKLNFLIDLAMVTT